MGTKMGKTIGYPQIPPEQCLSIHFCLRCSQPILPAMKLRALPHELLRKRPEASPVGYWLMFFPLFLLGLYSAHEDWVGAVPYLLLAGFCAFQIRRRTYAGWVLLFGMWALYAVVVAKEMMMLNPADFTFGLLIGPLPAVLLFIFR